MERAWAWMVLLFIVGILAGCGSAPLRVPAERAAAASARTAGGVPAGAVPQGRGVWVPVDWSALPGWGRDNLFEAWNAWIKSCEKAVAPWAALCPEIRQLSIATPEEQQAWIEARLQPFRIESASGESTGLLTSYFEPVIEASRQPAPGFAVPLYGPPAGLSQRKPWYTRQEMDTLPEAQAALRGRAIAYMADPVDAMVLQIQGSGRVRVNMPDGSKRWVRLAYAGSNDQPYRSVGRWLLDQGLVKDASWPGIKAWLQQNPGRQQELLWSNPRVVFFKEEGLSELESAFGPRGAQGVALTPGRSIAVDPSSLPYGTPVWLVSPGPQTALQKLVLAQDTGSAINGVVRADYFAGWGAEAGDLAGRLRQPLQMWAIWPK